MVGAKKKSNNYLEPGINTVKMKTPRVEVMGQYNTIVFPFHKNGSDKSNDVKIFIPSRPTKWATVEQQLERASENITEIFSLFVPFEQLEAAGQFNTLQEMLSAFNRLLPEGFDEIELELAATFKHSKKDGKSYLNIAQGSLAKGLTGGQWIRVKDGNSPAITWNADFEESLTRLPETPVEKVQHEAPTANTQDNDELF